MNELSKDLHNKAHLDWFSQFWSEFTCRRRTFGHLGRSQLRPITSLNLLFWVAGMTSIFISTISRNDERRLSMVIQVLLHIPSSWHCVGGADLQERCIWLLL